MAYHAQLSSIILVVFESGSHVTQVDLKPHMYMRLPQLSRTGVNHHHTWLQFNSLSLCMVFALLLYNMDLTATLSGTMIDTEYVK